MQVFLPGAGWLDYDPTNSLSAGFDLIPVAIARHPAQAVPLAGSFLFVPLGALLFLAAPWLAHGVTELDLVLLRGLLGPGSPDSTELTERVRDLEVTRARAVDDSAARLRGIDQVLSDLLKTHEFRRDWVWSNVPPAWVHHLKF